MKSLIQKTSLFLLSAFATVYAVAQEKKLDVDINVGKKDEWYQQPWLWVVGGAVFILLLVALMRRK